MKFELEETLRGAPDDSLLADMRRSAELLGRHTLTMDEYARVGKAHPSTIQRRFGSWPRALERAGLQPSRSKLGISDDELFKNIEEVWISLGRQPKYSDVKIPQSHFSARTYEKRFGSWSNALRKFVEWANTDPVDQTPDNPDNKLDENPLRNASPARRTRRDISDRQRFRILFRDGFCCKSCGSSPLIKPGTELHVDHILPWSKGGETVDGNLETKCKQCNLGKGNAFSV
jgi:hypothetical protein